VGSSATPVTSDTASSPAMAASKLVSRLSRTILPPECLGPHRVVVEGSNVSRQAIAPLLTATVQEPEAGRGAAGPYGPPPLALVFGWAGSSPRNLAKYASLYQSQGCTTAHLTLPTRLIFQDTAEVPQVMGEVAQQLEELGVRERPLLVHCLSDTGAMCYQGLQLATRGALDVRGVVWDSCCGPIPEITAPRVAALLAVNYFCARGDGADISGAVLSSYRLLVKRGWPNYLRKLQGQPVDLSLMEGVWAGHFGRDHHLQYPGVPELFLYSNGDFYLPHKYLEREVLDKRRRRGVPFSATRFQGSAHVQHYRKHPAQYEAAVQQFMKVAWGRLEQEVEQGEEVLEQEQYQTKRGFPQLTGSFGV